MANREQKKIVFDMMMICVGIVSLIVSRFKYFKYVSQFFKKINFFR